MATDIVLSDLINGSIVIDSEGNHRWVGTGVFDKLIDGVNQNLETQYKNQRINGADYAMVYSNSIVAVMSQAVEYLLREKLVEAQIDDTLAGIDLKEEQTRLTYVQRVKVDKETALLGLDEVIQNCNTSPEAAYTPRYVQ